jgi:hypothetical protein
MIINDDSSIVNKLETSVTDDARVIIYDHHMFIVHATGSNYLRAELGLGSALPRGVRLGFLLLKNGLAYSSEHQWQS